MQFLKVLEGIRTPQLDRLFGMATYLGSEYIFVLISLVLFWCVDKRWGYRLLYMGLLGGVFNQFLKAAFCVQRPWMEDLSLNVVEGAKETAQGYSFPSGHTQATATVATAIACMLKKTWITVLCAAAVILVAFSRMYLGVHTLLDVIAAMLFGIVTGAAFSTLWEKARQKTRLEAFLWLGLLLCCVLELLYVFFGLGQQAALVAQEEHASEAACIMAGMAAGMIACRWLDGRWLHFTVEAPWWVQALKTGTGLVLLYGIRNAALLFLPPLFGEWLGIGLSYFLVMLFAGAVWPLSFRAWARIGKQRIRRMD